MQRLGGPSALTLTEDELTALVRVRLNEVGNQHQLPDPLDVVHGYRGFFMAVAEKTDRLNTTSLIKAILNIHEMQRHEAKQLAMSLCGASAESLGNFKGLP